MLVLVSVLSGAVVSVVLVSVVVYLLKFCDIVREQAGFACMVFRDLFLVLVSVLGAGVAVGAGAGVGALWRCR